MSVPVRNRRQFDDPADTVYWNQYLAEWKVWLYDVAGSEPNVCAYDVVKLFEYYVAKGDLPVIAATDALLEWEIIAKPETMPERWKRYLAACKRKD